MGDRVAIPRSFADQLGVQDTLPSVRRHYMTIPLFHPLNNTTTGNQFGADSNTTGNNFLQRNVTFEKLLVTGLKRTTVNGKTTLLYMYLLKNGVSTVATMVMLNSTTLGERWHAASTTPRLPNGIAADKHNLRIVTRNQMTRLSVMLVFRERTDS